MTGRPDLDGTLQVAADEFLKGIGANVVQIYLSTPGSLLRIAVSSGTPLSPEPKTNLQPGQGYAREAITRAPVLYIRDLERGDPAEGRQLLIDLDLRSCLAVPLVSRGRILGAMVAFGRRPISPDAEALQFVEILGGLVAVAVERSQLRQSDQEAPERPQDTGMSTTIAGLNASQLAILRLMVEGRSNRQIGEAVHLSENTIKFHVREIFRKLKARNRVEAAMAAVRRGIL
ncbi:MAG: GAF domain-containing protein [Chloroflexi bacterium]|nr:MAG: GAF domain-containing protein [Chloroflexota bacterium]TME48323.1 MAG: GAF domain-containing protein [Chloroflexota bacterium]